VYLPNLITVTRILMVPVIIWLTITGRFTAAFVVFVLAGLSDGIDGFLARRYAWRTELGAFLDPIADKLLLGGLFLALGLLSHLPAWLVIIVISRDVLIIGAVILAWMMDRPLSMRPILISKLNTAAQIVLIGLVLAQLGFMPQAASAVSAFVWLTGGLTAVSASVYIVRWLHHMSGPAP
jgi:cardiolipin synthase